MTGANTTLPPSRRRPLPDPRLAISTPAGVQPERDGWLLCLECGHWSRLLHSHLRAHGMSSADYRQHHGLSLKHRLAAADIRAGHSERIRARVAANPQQAAAWRHHEPAQRAIYAATGRERAAATSDRPERRRISHTNGRRIGAQIAQRQRHILDQRAREHGHTDLHALLTAHPDHTNSELVALLGITRRAIGGWRQRLCGSTPTQHQARQRIRQQTLDAKAQKAGYPTFEKLITATLGHPLKPLARHTGIAVNTIRKHRANTQK